MWIGAALIIIGGLAWWYADQVEWKPAAGPMATSTATTTAEGGSHCAPGVACQAPSPTPTSTSLDTTFSVSIGGQHAVNSTFNVAPIAITEDSRCPAGAKCVWAGEVSVKVQINDSGRVTTTDLTLGAQTATERTATVTVGSYIVTMIAVAPVKQVGVTLNAKDYVITYEVKQ